NVGSYFEGANLVAFTTQQTGSPAVNAIDDNPNTQWLPPPGQVTNQSFTLELPRAPVSFDRLRLINGSSGQGVKHFEVRVSTATLDDADFQTVLTGFAVDNTRVQEFVLPAAVPARYVRLLAKD